MPGPYCLGQAGEIISPPLPPSRSALLQRHQPCGLCSVSPALLRVSQDPLYDASPTDARRTTRNRGRDGARDRAHAARSRYGYSVSTRHRAPSRV